MMLVIKLRPVVQRFAELMEQSLGSEDPLIGGSWTALNGQVKKLGSSDDSTNPQTKLNLVVDIAIEAMRFADKVEL